MKNLIFGLLSLMFFGCCHKTNQDNQIIDLEKNSYQNFQNCKENAEKVLVRAKELIQILPSNEDPYGLKNVFASASILTATCKDGKLNFETEIGKGYIIVFLLPKTLEDYKNIGGLETMGMFVMSNINSSIPVFAVINPKYFYSINKDIDLDWYASCMLHELIHITQRSIILRSGKELGRGEEQKQREKEAYSFQSKFINFILKRNNIDPAIIVPTLSPQEQQHMTYDKLVNVCKEVDRVNKFKLSEISNLIIYDAYPDMYLNFANYDYIEKN